MLFKGFKTPKGGQEMGYLLNKKNADRFCIQKITSQTKLL